MSEVKIDLHKLIESVPRDTLKKISLHDIHRIVKNYNGSKVVNELKADTHETMAVKLRWLADDAARAVMHPLASTLSKMADEVKAGA